MNHPSVEIYLAGNVLRYHSNPKMARLQQKISEHTWGMLALLYLLNPLPSPELAKAITFHDVGERWAGDLSYVFKIEYPEFAAEHARIEHDLAKRNGVPQVELNEVDAKWLSMLDRMEAFMFLRSHHPEDVHNADWQANNRKIVDIAIELGVERQVLEILNNGLRFAEAA